MGKEEISSQREVILEKQRKRYAEKMAKDWLVMWIEGQAYQGL